MCALVRGILSISCLLPVFLSLGTFCNMSCFAEEKNTNYEARALHFSCHILVRRVGHWPHTRVQFLRFIKTDKVQLHLVVNRYQTVTFGDHIFLPLGQGYGKFFEVHHHMAEIEHLESYIYIVAALNSPTIL